MVALGASMALHAGLGVAMYTYGVGHVEPLRATGVANPVVASDLALAMQGVGMPLPAPPPEHPAAREQAKQSAPEEQQASTPPTRAPGPGDKPHLEIEVTPGIDRSDADTPNWLGAAKGTEHHAKQSTTDQPALSRDPGKRGAEDEELGQAVAEEREHGTGGSGTGEGSGEGDESGPAREEAVPGQDADRPAARAREGRSGAPDGAEDGTAGSGATVRDEFAATQPDGTQIVPVPPKPHDPTGLMPEQKVVEHEPVTSPVDAQEPEKPAGLSVDPAAAVNAAVLGAPTSAGGGQAPAVKPGSESKVPGKKSDAEVPASSREISAKFKPGTPIAHEGIRIRPKLPRYTMVTRATSRPNNPLVIIKFNRAGKVVKAEFAPGRSTGSADWDGPLLASLYEWTAAGKKLQELPVSDPDAVLVLRLEYLLHD
jgi:hypothetical protein